VQQRDLVGVDRLIWATDFPHQGSEWPKTWSRVIEPNFSGVPEEETYQMACGNACEFFGLDEEVYQEESNTRTVR
jgi:predicted TIM-barrel fold metal-dependent hydrolase